MACGLASSLLTMFMVRNSSGSCVRVACPLHTMLDEMICLASHVLLPPHHVMYLVSVELPCTIPLFFFSMDVLFMVLVLFTQDVRSYSWSWPWWSEPS